LAVIVCVPFFKTVDERPVAMSVKLALTAEEKMVLPGMKVLTILKTPEPLNGNLSSHNRRNTMEECVVCGDKGLSRRLCVKHYNEAMRKGTLGEFPKKTPEEYFWEKVIKHDEGCWEWIGATGVKGYGHIRFNGKVEIASRVSWFIHHGEWPPSGMMVLHHCDNPPCTRDDHLFVGTNTDNMRDAAEKGRLVVNETHWRTRLSADDARTIRTSGEPNTVLAKRYGISEPHVSNIKAGRSRYRA
jgi:hypothetical protein